MCRKSRFGEQIHVHLEKGRILSLPQRISLLIQKSFEDNISELYEGVFVEGFEIKYCGLFGDNHFQTPILRFFKDGIELNGENYQSAEEEEE